MQQSRPHFTSDIIARTAKNDPHQKSEVKDSTVTETQSKQSTNTKTSQSIVAWPIILALTILCSLILFASLGMAFFRFMADSLSNQAKSLKEFITARILSSRKKNG